VKYQKKRDKHESETDIALLSSERSSSKAEKHFSLGSITTLGQEHTPACRVPCDDHRLSFQKLSGFRNSKVNPI
jgi:hypothetical protein